MGKIKANLDKRICDCLENSTNTETYRKFIVNGYKFLGCPLSKQKEEYLDKATNEELNDIVEELDYLLDK